MKIRHLFYGIAIAVPAFIAGLLANEFAWAQGKETPSAWKYKIVELSYQFPAGADRPLMDIPYKDHNQRRKDIEGLINKNGADGWELVSYENRTAIYKQKAIP